MAKIEWRGNVMVVKGDNEEEIRKAAIQGAVEAQKKRVSENVAKSASESRKKAAADQRGMQDDVVSGNKHRAREYGKTAKSTKSLQAKNTYEDTILRVGSQSAKDRVQDKRWQMAGKQAQINEQTAKNRYEEAQRNTKAIESKFTSSSGYDDYQTDEERRQAKNAENQAKAQYDYARGKTQSWQDSDTTRNNVKAIESMPKVDRDGLRRYAYTRGYEIQQNMMPYMDVKLNSADRMAKGLFDKYGEERVKELAETLIRVENEQQTADVAAAGTSFGEKTGGLSIVPTVLANVGSGISGPLDIARDMQMRTGQYSTADPNLTGNLGAVFSETTQQAATKGMSQFGAGAYNLGVTVTDIAAQAVFGPAAPVISAMRGFNEGFRSATQNGAPPEKAALAGGAKAVIEMASEKIPLDELFKTAKTGGKGFWNFLKGMAKQGGVESISELINLAGTTFSEAAILRENSSRNRNIADKVGNGMSYKEAKQQENQVLLEEAFQTALMSFLAGDITYAGAYTIGNYGQKKGGQAMEQDTPVSDFDEATEHPGEAVQEVPKPVVQEEQRTRTPEAPAPKQPEPASAAAPQVQEAQQQPAQQVKSPEQLRAETIQRATEKNVQKRQQDKPATKGNNNQAKLARLDKEIAELKQRIVVEEWDGDVSGLEAELAEKLNARDALSATTKNSPAMQATEATAARQGPERSAERAEPVPQPNPTAPNAPTKSPEQLRKETIQRATEMRTEAAPKSEPVQERNYAAMHPADILELSPVEYAKAKVQIEQAGSMAGPVDAFDRYTRSINESRFLEQENAYNDLRRQYASNRKKGESFKDYIYSLNEDGTPMTEVAPGSVPQEEQPSPTKWAADQVVNKTLGIAHEESQQPRPSAVENTETQTQGADRISELEADIADLEQQMDTARSDSEIDELFPEWLEKSQELDALKKGGEATGQNPMSERDFSDAKDRKVNAYQYDNPEVKPFFQAEAEKMSQELADTIPGERYYNDSTYYESGGEKGYSGHNRVTSKSIAEMRDSWGMRYDDIRKGLNSIVQDDGAENNAAAKKVEMMLNKRLSDGYTDMYTGKRVAPNEAYVQLMTGHRPDSPRIKGTGAAEIDFSQKPAYNATLSEDNAQADRRDDVRPLELPKQDINDGNVSAVTGNVYGSKITPDEFASLMEEPTAKGDFSYVTISNDKATQMATETIASAGTWENAYDSWKQSVANGNAGAEMSARGALFLNHAAQQGNKQHWLETLHYMQELGTNTAQGLQAMRIIRTLAPVDKTEFLKMSVWKMAEGIKTKYGVDIQVDQKLIDKYANAETDEVRDAVLSDLQQNLADQIPSTALDKWTALRYTNMLGNLRTNDRNIVGNVGSAVAYRFKDTIAAGIEAMASKVSGGKTERTKSLFVGKPLLKACKEDFQLFKEMVSAGGKYGDNMSAKTQFAQGVQDKRRIFKSKNKVLNAALAPMEGYRKGTNWMMNNKYFGDEAFGRIAYSRALAGYLKANGVKNADLSKVAPALMDKARAYAIQEAQEATFRDNSALARIVSKVQKDTGVVGQGIMPFTKTPANVLTRAEEFSPLGLINSTVKSVQAANGKGNVTGADVINSWSKTLTGTVLFALGAVMFDQGLLAGGPDEDEEKAQFDELNGYQNYAIQLPDGTNYTIDWLTPVAMPMFMGAQFWKEISKDGDFTFADMERVFTSIGDPLIQMSMLQGLNDSLGNIKYADDNLGQFFINAVTSYLTQGISNTLLGQIERATEDTRQTTYINKTSETPEWAQRQLGKLSQKIPGWDYQQTDYRNAWGETEENEGGLIYNLLSPGYISKAHTGEIAKELYRIRETTGENVFPQEIEKTISVVNASGITETKQLSPKEYAKYGSVRGEASKKGLKKLIASDEYQAMSDSEKAEAVNQVFADAKEAGRNALADYSGFSEEAVSEINRLHESTGDGAAFYQVPTANMAYTDKKGTRKTVQLSPEDYTVYSEKKKSTVSSIVDKFLKSPAYKQLSDENKLEAMKYANQYAEEAARKSAVKDYYADPDDWKNKTGPSLAATEIVMRVEKDIYNKAMSDFAKGISSGFEMKQRSDSLKNAYADYAKMPVSVRDYVYENSGGTAKTYLEARKAQISHEAATRVMSEVMKLDDPGAYDTYEAVAKAAGGDYALADKMMKVYMPDYDPSSKSPNKTELKYDDFREMGFEPEQFAELYNIKSGIAGKGAKARKIDAYMASTGCDKQTATMLYYLFDSYPEYEKRYG